MRLRSLAAGGVAVWLAACTDSPAPTQPLVSKGGTTFVASDDGAYVLRAASWGDAQSQAVVAAGGSVVYSHGKAGIGIASSTASDFLTRALASGAFLDGARDGAVQWQPPTETVTPIEAAVTPADETFINFQWNTQAIEAPAAWAAGFSGQGARVAVLDGGIHSAHVDLDANIDVARSTSFVPGFAFNQDVGTFWHGTHVAGIVAAEDDGIGTIGVAPSAKLIGVKVLHNGSGQFAWIIRGILYAATPVAQGGGGAHIINLSLGATFARGGGNTGAGPLIAALNQAVNYASATALVVAAAGNNGLDLDHSGSFITVPAQSGNAIAVSATGPVGYAVGYPNGATNFRRPASYTNFGSSAVWLAAPGGDNQYSPSTAQCTIPLVPSGAFTTACWTLDMVLSTIRGSSGNNWYSWARGTSMAAPAVSGVAALLVERFPGASVSTLKTRLAQTADDDRPYKS